MPAVAPATAEPQEEIAGEAPARWERVLLVATWLVVAAGAALRIRQWWHPRSFWLDELMLVRAIAEQRFDQLLQPLHYAQAAPPGWLLAEHVLIGIVPGERGARLLPLLLGIGTVVLAALLARTLLGPVAALVATGLVAGSTQLITYSAEAKQYSADSFWLLLVLLVGCRLALGRGRPDRDRYVLATVAGVAVWCSHVTALAIAGVFLALGLAALTGRRWRELLVLAGCALPYGIGLAVEYVTLLSDNAGDAYLQSFWRGTLPPPGPLTLPVVRHWFAIRTAAVTANPLSLPYGWPLLVLLLAGLVVLGLRRRPALPVLLLPVALVVAAGLAGKYPISNRLALWLVPLVALVLAAPLDLPLLARGRAQLAAAVVLALAVAGQLATMATPWAHQDAHYLRYPREVEEARPLLARLAAERRPGDLVLVDRDGARFAAAYYGPKVGLGDYRLRSGNHQRVWLVAIHTRAEVLRYDRAVLSQFGPQAAELSTVGAYAYRYDRGTGGPPTGPQRWCLRQL